MSANESFPQTGIIVSGDDEDIDNMGELARAILDDVIYNIIHDIVLKTHRDEKMARAATAAIIVEQKAAETDLNSFYESSATASGEARPHKVETSGAIYKDGEVYLKGNPLKTTDEIRCGKCGLPRLLHPTDGNGARKPDPNKEYCKRRPFIEKPHHDIYGQTFVPEGPGRGKKKKDVASAIKSQQESGTPGPSQDSPAPSPPVEGKPISFPHAKCHHCNTFLPIKRMNNHMVKCIGGGGRDSSRTALWKIQNGSSSQNGSTPPGSRTGTPLPGAKRSSPNKRDADDFDDESDESPKKKKSKKNNAKLKAPKMAKSGSHLSFEHKRPGEEDEGDEEYGTSAASKKKVKQEVKKNKLLHGKGGVKPPLPPVEPAEPPDIKNVVKNGRGGDGESESSQTLSSPS